MSYILDALRKSEQERQRGKVPDIHGAGTETVVSGGKANPWPIITVTVVVINLALLVYFWFQFTGNEQPAAVSPAPQKMVSEPALPEFAPAPPATPTLTPPQPGAGPVVSADKAPPPPAQTQRSDPQPAQMNSLETGQSDQDDRVPSVGYLPQLEELPAYERDGIPDMTFSSHMYSSIPRFRSIIINGKRLKEGQYLNQELQVREITESGVVLSRGGTLFEVDVLGRWAQ
ncbi:MULTISPECIES: general secretion pathway protein GspB [unclassified Ketobacter]|uniref:general secretion pathway protein GspB n=1 Tax=unclassified Ketobacter TaxID=2639109 RepID=UPI000F10696A|nr:MULTISPECIES: general secretion pathway protein GspB [unclassified Ketobacter]RLT90122.1 MAG: hypothetical protein D9N13_10915 [Ketobacter sp. GenoA1]RLT99133.1 MAG: hypothetical protein D9N15_04215 [Ketobacter sp.]